MDIAEYLESVRKIFATGAATEHSYRPALESLFRSIDADIEVINEPKRSEGGMPDFLFSRNGVAFGWAEAKDIDKDVIKLKGYSVEQRKRYENAYPNLLYTNGVDFEFIRDKEVVHHVSIASFLGELGGLQPLPERFDELQRQLELFAEQKPISIRSAPKLAEMMAGKAAIIKDEIGIALADDADFRTALGRQFTNFKDNLLPNLTPAEFADIYAETITYGMFAARLHDDTLDTFSRQEALDKLPKTNPFLRGLFQYVAGYDIPDRLRYIVDDLAQVLRASDPHSLFEDFGKFTARNDPFIHFYETFLAAYNPAKRKARGVWYTPEPVVDFIVRSVDDVLKTEFGLADGLADTSKVTVDWDTGQNHPKTGKPRTIRKDVHRVQILDPATGTGTFLAKVVQTIADRVKARAPSLWSNYVENDLLPRLHGFELLMASYAMCHTKLDMQLAESGYVRSENPPQGGKRLSVWLTNALEPAEREVKDLFFQQLADEARGAADVKRQTPIMCVIGNPPYSGISQNMGKWITGLIEDYKYVDGDHFHERKHWLHDDYVKFMRMSEELIAKNPSGGVFGFITNHGYLDNPTFRGMRWHLLKTFDKIWVLDLHGNSKKKEMCPDGSSDKNVFDIQQGVALIIAMRKGAGTEKLAEVWHGDMWGKRKAKNHALGAQSLRGAVTTRLRPVPPYSMFYDIDQAALIAFDRGFDVSKIFDLQATGIITARDNLAISFSKAELQAKLSRFLSTDKSDADARQEFFGSRSSGKYPSGDSRGWKLPEARVSLRQIDLNSFYASIQYRPFDYRYILYHRDLVDWPRFEAMGSVPTKPNIALVSPRMTADGFSPLVSTELISNKTGSRYDQSYFFPLYLYPGDDADQIDALAPTDRTLNLDPKLYAQICEAARIDPAVTASPTDDFRTPTADERPSEIKVFDYIYGVLHSPDYRATFAEFLKIDFPRIPYPASPEVFAHVGGKGEQLRRLHLMEPAVVGDTPYPLVGEPEGVETGEVASRHPRYEKGRIYINGKGTDGQYFDNVPKEAWDFYIGGYQPAQKWLKDRKGRALSWHDVGHYQRIVKILVETNRIMSEIKLPLEDGD
ncbi:type ISP restriction/modification enzyme [Salinisphaera sp.]|uniref:type ISP restriction/modification enzyme n=1 Tax=Salinisphaera sp. TaxID=1914330 RepID=UPI000C5C52C2|nr:type ISP restriction/modification enzyme [Salinisphaera sp.]MAS11658.1 DNA methyltransferase [Salinisphaera sp.]